MGGHRHRVGAGRVGVREGVFGASGDVPSRPDAGGLRGRDESVLLGRNLALGVQEDPQAVEVGQPVRPFGCQGMARSDGGQVQPGGVAHSKPAAV